MISLNQRLMFFSRIQYWERESATWWRSCKTEPFWAERLTKTLGPGVWGWFNSNCVIDAETCFLQKNSGLRIIREPPQVSKLTIREAGRNSFWCFQQCHLCQIKSCASLSTSLGSKWDFVPPSVICSTKCPTIIQDWEVALQDLQVLKLTKLVACFSTLLGIETWGYIFNSNCQKKVGQEFQIKFLKTPVKAELKWKTPVNFNLFIDLFHHRMQRMYKGCANKYAWKGQSNGELNRITFKWSPHRQKSNQLGCMGHRKYIRENTV